MKHFHEHCITIQVRQTTIAAATIAELRRIGKLETRGPIKVPTSKLVGQTPSHVKSAIFHRAGGSTVRNHASKPCSSLYVRSPSVNSSTCFCHLPNRPERENASLSCS